MYGISTYDIQTIDTKLELQRKYICSRFFDFGEETKSAIEFTYSANLNPKKYFAEIFSDFHLRINKIKPIPSRIPMYLGKNLNASLVK